ncbi:MAG: hypothetical protein ACPGO5_02765 [Patescibacteria group bacterium]
MTRIHFLNVGAGDCAIIHFPPREITDASGRLIKTKNERIMMIDMNHHDSHDEYEDVISYYKLHFGTKPIFRFICTHPHHDHICGLHKIFADQDIEILNFWDVIHGFAPESFDGHTWHKADWDTYQHLRSDSTQTPKTINVLRETAPFAFWDDSEDRISVLSPTLDMIKELHGPKQDGSKREAHEVDIDDLSYALLLKIGPIKVVFAGDGREQVWNDIVENCGSLIQNTHILKAGHHGHESGFHEEAIKLMDPEFIIFSNSANEDGKNGASSLYETAVPGVDVYKTFELGNIIANCDYDGSIEFEYS